MEAADWYELTNGASLQQGDLLMQCPIFSVVGNIPFPIPDSFEPTIDARFFDIITMTQSCDLENDKIEEVLFAQVIAWPDAVHAGGDANPALRSREFRRALIAGNIPSLSLLHNRIAFPTIAWSVVDFHRLFTLPKSFVRTFADLAGPRLRLRSPYREHLAQAFARYFMRVGLPHDAKAFEQEGKIEN
jgi:hypothetical protein